MERTAALKTAALHLNLREGGRLRQISEGFVPVLGLEADAAPEFGAVVHGAVGDHEFNLANIADGFEWIGAQDGEVGALSRLDGTKLFVEAHHACRNYGGGLNCLHRRESCLHV